MFGVGWIWEDDFWPEKLWITLQNLLPPGAIVAFITVVVLVYKKGPGLLIKYGGEWMTKLGNWWDVRRNG